MKQGRPIPPRVREFIVNAKRNAPGLTYNVIALRVRAECGVKIDKTSVGRILREHKQTAGPKALSSFPQEASQPASEAQRKHQQRIEKVLIDWQDELEQQLKLGDMGLIDTSPAKVEAKRLFPRVLEHCPSIRNTYDELVKRRHIYEERWMELESEIRPLAPPEAVEAFAKMVVFLALSLAEGTPIPEYDYSDGDWLEVGLERTGIARGSPEIRRQIEERHRSLIRRYSNDQRVLEMVNMKKAILEEQHQMANTLEDSLDRQEYLTASVKCRICPG